MRQEIELFLAKKTFERWMLCVLFVQFNNKFPHKNRFFKFTLKLGSAYLRCFLIFAHM